MRLLSEVMSLMWVYCVYDVVQVYKSQLMWHLPGISSPGGEKHIPHPKMRKTQHNLQVPVSIHSVPVQAAGGIAKTAVGLAAATEAFSTRRAQGVTQDAR